MKPSPLSKILVSGLMASAFLTLVACNNASKRSIKAAFDPKLQSQQTPVDANTECTKDIVASIDDRAKVIDPIKASLTAAAQKPLTSAEKEALQTLIQSLKPKTDALIKEIRSARVNDKPISGCYVQVATTVATKLATKKISYSIQSLTVEDLLLGKRVKDITQKTNDIVDLAAKDADLTAQTTVSQNQVYQIKSELADQVGPENKDGHMYVLDGQVVIGADTQDELTALIQEKKKSVCSLLASTAKADADVSLKVVSISEKVSDDRKSAESQVVFSGGKDQVFTFKCSLSSSNDIPTEVRSVFGELISLDANATANPSTDESPFANPSSAQSTDETKTATR